MVNDEIIKASNEQLPRPRPPLQSRLLYLYLTSPTYNTNTAVSRSPFRGQPRAQQTRQVGVPEVLQQGQLPVKVTLRLPRSVLYRHLKRHRAIPMGVASSDEALAHRPLSRRNNETATGGDSSQRTVRRRTGGGRAGSVVDIPPETTAIT